MLIEHDERYSKHVFPHRESSVGTSDRLTLKVDYPTPLFNPFSALMKCSAPYGGGGCFLYSYKTCPATELAHLYALFLTGLGNRGKKLDGLEARVMCRGHYKCHFTVK